MTSKTLESPEEWGPSQTSTIQHAFQLLEDNLQPEECDTASPAYRLGWYEHLQANRLRREVMEQFRHFVDEMAERALKRSFRTVALFPSGSATGLNGARCECNVPHTRAVRHTQRRHRGQKGVATGKGVSGR